MNDSYSSGPPEVDDRCLVLRAIVHEVANGDGLRIAERAPATRQARIVAAIDEESLSTPR